MFVSLWEFFYGHFFRFWMKWLLRQMTGKCELQRIFDTYVGAQRTHRIENSLTYSKNKCFVGHTKRMINKWVVNSLLN
uniref:ELMO domain containing 2 n=1 Tax=Equus caballus TaxID=9796 RepID=A0A9L0RQ93_HORSE